MFSNRITRLIVGVVAQALFFVAFFFLCNWATGVESSDLTMVPMFAVLLALIAQILYDILDIEFMNEIVGRIIKRVIFYLAAGLALILFYTTILGFSESGAGLVSIPKEYGVFPGMFVSAAGLGCGVTAAVATILTRDDTSDEKRSALCFAGAIGMVASLLLGIVLTLCCKDYEGLALTSSIVGIVILVIVTVLFGLPFDYDDDGFHLLGIILSKLPKKASSSRSGSSSGSRRSSGSYSGSSYSGGGSSSGGDGRKSDIIGNLGIEMNAAARRASNYHSLAYGCGINLDVSYSIYGGNIVFKISGRLSGGNITSEYEANSVRDELQSVLRSVASELQQDASHRIDNLRDEYKDFDRDYCIEVKMGNIR